MNKEREKLILEKLIREKKVYVKDLAKEIYASEQSIRRDLQSLEKQGLVKRLHGGAILEESSASKMKIPFLIREMEQADEKTMIAKKAAELVKDNDVIMMDGSSSAYTIVPFLTSRRNLTVITNGLRTAVKAAELGINTYCTGGNLISSFQALTGNEAYSVIDSFNADICFFSCRGLSVDGMLTDFSIEENLVRKHMIQQSKCRVFLCNSKKIGGKHMHNLCSTKDIDYIISDVPLPKNLAEKEFR